MPSIVIVGGGHAAAQFCSEFAAQRAAAPPNPPWTLTVLSQEAHAPYQRPPLSKQRLREADAALQPLLGTAFFEEQGIALRLRTRVTQIDRVHQQVLLQSAADGAPAERLPYDHLVLATGARARCLPQYLADGAGIAGVHVLRTADDAARLAAALPRARSLAVLGAGFIGLEVAATAASLGLQVSVVDPASRLLARAVSPALSAHLYEAHRPRIDFRLGERVLALRQHEGRFTGLQLSRDAVAAELLLVGIGAEPEVALAREAGLACDNGIAVDAGLGTTDPRIFAMGDCAAFPDPGGGARMRLESVQNAQAQARLLAQRLLGGSMAGAYVPAPSFWSEQGAVRLQIAGLWQPLAAEPVRRVGAHPGSFSLLHYAGPRLLAVESVNAPGDHMAARRWLAKGHSPQQHLAADAAVPLTAL